MGATVVSGWPAPAPSTRFLTRLASTSMGLATTGIFPVFLTGALAVQMSSEFGYSTPGIGLSIAAFYVFCTASSITLGRIADRVGWRRAIRYGALGCMTSLVAIGLLARSLTSVVLLIGVAGLSNALLQPSVNLFIARSSPTANRGLMFGLKQSAIPLATFIGGISVPAVALTLGWRWVFLGAAVFGAVALALLPRREPRRREPEAAESVPGPSDRPRTELRSLTVVSLLGQTGASVLGSFVVVSAVHVGISEGAAGLLLAGASVAGIIARVLIGWSADRGVRPDLTLIVACLGVGALGLVILAIPQTWAAIFGTLIGFVAGWGWPGLFNLIVVSRFPRAPATATSVTQIGVYVGNGAGPLLFGLLATWSFAAAWLTSAAFLLISAAVGIRQHSLERKRTT